VCHRACETGGATDDEQAIDWRGNVGLRAVQTKERVLVTVAIPGSVCAVLAPCP